MHARCARFVHGSSDSTAREPSMPPTPSALPPVVVIGAGFAGTTLVRALDQRWPGGAHVTLISDESYTTFNPMLPEAVGASVFPEQVVVPVREMLRTASEEHTSELQSRQYLVCRLLLEKKKKSIRISTDA